MKSRDFCYWLQGYFELANPTHIDGATLMAIRNHLNMVFIHEIDPSFPAEQQSALDAAHQGGFVRAPFDPLAHGGGIIKC